jgi:hypothetical protein
MPNPLPPETTPEQRCPSVEPTWSQCELPKGHDGPHASIIDEQDEDGKIPPRYWTDAEAEQPESDAAFLARCHAERLDAHKRGWGTVFNIADGEKLLGLVESQDAEIAKLRSVLQRVVDEHEIHDNDTLLDAVLNACEPRSESAASVPNTGTALSEEERETVAKVRSRCGALTSLDGGVLLAIIDRLSSAPSRGSDSDEPACPHCARPLRKVRYPGGHLNEDQWDSVRAGDWFCEDCRNWPKRYRYFWNSDLAPLVTESAGGTNGN